MQTDGGEETVSRSSVEIPQMLASRTAYLLARSALRARELLNARLAELGIHARHFAVLAMLMESPAAQVEMSGRLCIDRTSMVSLLDELEALGLVRRTTHPQDRRMHVVQATRRGLEVAREADRCAGRAEESLLAVLNPKEREHLHRLLTRIVMHGN